MTQTQVPEVDPLIVSEHPLMADVHALVPRLVQHGMSRPSPVLGARAKRFAGRLEAIAEDVALHVEMALAMADIEGAIEIRIESPREVDTETHCGHDFDGCWNDQDGRFVVFYSSEDGSALSLYLFCRRDGAIMLITIDEWGDAYVGPTRTLDEPARIVEELVEALNAAVPDDTIH